MRRCATQGAKFALGNVLLGLVISLGWSLSWSSGWAQEPAAPKPPNAKAPAASAATQPPSSPNKVVLKVGGLQLTQAEFDALLESAGRQPGMPIPPQQRRYIGDQYATMVVLSRRAAADHLDDSPEVRRMLELGRMNTLASAEMKNLTKQVEAKPEEIDQYYTAHKDEYEELKVHRVTVRKKPENAKEGTAGLSAQDAKTRAEEIRKALAAGTDPKKVAEQFKSPSSASDVTINTEPQSLWPTHLPPDQFKAAFALKDGELTPSQETPSSITFMQVVKHGYRDLKDVSPTIGRKLQQERMKTAMDDLKKSANIWMDDEYFPVAPPTPPMGQMPAPGAARPASGAPAPPNAVTASPSVPSGAGVQPAAPAGSKPSSGRTPTPAAPAAAKPSSGGPSRY